MAIVKGSTSRWLLLLAQLPASPSSARVTLWRRLRAAGAASLQNGVWVLPKTAAHVALFEQLLEVVRQQGGSGVVLTASEQAADVSGAIAPRFEADRAREYEEFSERCGALLSEIAKETGRGKFSFAELEEVEDDLEKLTAWLEKIKARDFFPGVRLDHATEALTSCRRAIEGFARGVYKSEGIHAGTEASPAPRPASLSHVPRRAAPIPRKRPGSSKR